MVAIELLSWWYGPGWKLQLHNSRLRMIKVSHLFSVPILLRTLTAPWRRIITYPGASLDAKLRAMGDNMVSRLVGLTVRLGVLLAAGVILMFAALFSALLIIAWPLVPLAAAALLILAVMP